jgi:excisionase family DNA binding protein
MEKKDRALTPSEVAGIFGVDPKTVTRWAQSGKISSFRTPGGHRRYWESDVEAFMKAHTTKVSEELEDARDLLRRLATGAVA